MSNHRIAFITTALENIEPHTTTWALMYAAQNNGYQIFWMQPSDLHLHHDKPVGYMTSLRISEDFLIPAESFLAPLEHLDVLWWRVPASYQFDHLLALDLLQMLTTRTLVINHPPALRCLYPHIAAMQFPSLLPTSLITKNALAIESFLSEVGGKATIRPLHQPKLTNTFFLRIGDPNLRALIEALTQAETEYVLLQKLIAEQGLDGDKRVFLLDGEFLGMALQIPSAGELTANFNTQAIPAAIQPSHLDLALISQIGPYLRTQGIFLASLDICNGLITDLNTIAPEGLTQIQKVSDGDLCASIFVEIARKLSKTAA
jgi:glutathione synthase